MSATIQLDKATDRVRLLENQIAQLRDIRDGEKWFGSPAQPDRPMKRQLLALQKLPELLRRFNRFEKFVKSRVSDRDESDAKS